MRKRWPSSSRSRTGCRSCPRRSPGSSRRGAAGRRSRARWPTPEEECPPRRWRATTSGRRITGTYSTPESRSSSIPRDVSAASRSGLSSAFFPGSFHRPQSVKPVGPRSRSHRSHDLVDEACQRRLPGASPCVAARRRHQRRSLPSGLATFRRCSCVPRASLTVDPRRCWLAGGWYQAC